MEKVSLLMKDSSEGDSQKESETHSNYSIFDYSLRPTYDFCQAILSHGNLVEVLEPQWFRIQIGTMIQKMNQLYQ